MLVEGVRCRGAEEVVEAAVSSLRQLLEGGDAPPPQLGEHAGALIPALLKLSCDRETKGDCLALGGPNITKYY